MLIDAYLNSSATNVVRKTLSKLFSKECKVIEPLSLINPTILVSKNNIYNENVNYIGMYNRYYFITNVEYTTNNMMIVSLHEDVLTSLYDNVNIVGIIGASEDKYINDLPQSIPTQVNSQIKRHIFNEKQADVEGTTIVIQTPLPIYKQNQ